MARDTTKYEYNGVTYSKRGVVKAVVEDYVENHNLQQAELVFNKIRTDKYVVTQNGGDRYVHTHKLETSHLMSIRNGASVSMASLKNFSSLQKISVIN